LWALDMGLVALQHLDVYIFFWWLPDFLENLCTLMVCCALKSPPGAATLSQPNPVRSLTLSFSKSQVLAAECFGSKCYVFILLSLTDERTGIYFLTCVIKQEKCGTSSNKSPSILCTMTPPHPNPNHHISRMG